MKWFFPVLACSSWLLSSSQVQTSAQDFWQETARERLTAVYDEGAFRGRRFSAQWLPDSSGYIVSRRDEESGKRDRHRVDVRSGEVTQAGPETDTPASDWRLSPGGTQRLEFQDGNLFVRHLETDVRHALTPPKQGRDVSYRQARWSGDGKRVLFLESDASDVRQRNVLVPSDPSYPGVDQHRFARVGETITKLRVGVAVVESREVTWLPLEAPPEGFYLGQVEWAGNAEEVLVEKLSRFRDRREFWLFNVVSGTQKRIYHEQNEAWAISSQGKNRGLTWIRDGEAFVVISEQDGWRHAFLYSRSGERESLLTPGDYDIIDRAVVDEGGGWLYFYASPQEGHRKYLYRVPLDGAGTLQRVTPEGHAGTHDYQFSPDAKWAFHTWSTIDTPPLVELVTLPEHRVVRVLEENKELRAKMEALVTHPTEFLELDIGEGVVMDAWLMKPQDFDPAKKYPVFVYVYGEPHGQTVLDRFGAAQSHFHRVVADMGYVVVSIDNRGTPAPKGAAWRRAIFGSLGPLSTEDQAAGLKQLGAVRSFVDLSRVAIWGWSGGGSNTLNAMFRKPGLYDVGIAVVPKPQPHLYNAWFQEIYMRDREVNAEGYQRSAPLHFAEGLAGDLLMITGSGETNTHVQIIDGLVDRLIELGKPFDYMVYPNRNHGLSEGPGSVVHVRMLILRYLIEHLPRGAR